MNVAALLAEFVSTADPLKEPGLLDAANTAIFDGTACLVGGTREEFGRILHKYALSFPTEAGQCQVVASPLRTSPSAAAYINAASGHSLCYDDTSNNMMGHPTIVVLPACLAIGELVGATGLEMIEAYAIGVEVAVRVSELLAPGHYLRGWHATGIAGGIGAAAASAKLLGLDSQGIANALNIAATSAQGLRGNFGSMAMIYHIGLASRGGVDAAMLAREGMTSAADVFSGEIGYFSMFAGESGVSPVEELPKRLGQPFELTNPGLDVKPYPCGSLGHRAIQGVLELRKEYEIKPKNIAKIVCQIPELHRDVLVNVYPKDILESRINLVFPVSVAVVKGTCSVDDFSYEMMQDPRVLSVMEKVVIEGIGSVSATGADLFAAPAKVVVETTNGDVLERNVSAVKGSPQYPLTDSEWSEKFEECVLPSFGPVRAGELRKCLANLEGLTTVKDLAKLVAIEGGQ